MTQKLFADDPISHIAEDTLGRESFAKQVAKVCQNVSKESSSSVVALVGPWGSGKTSILSMVSSDLKKNKWSVAEFNPWLLSDIESLIRSFFSEVIGAIPTDKDANGELRQKISGYARVVSPLGKLGGLIGVDGSTAIEKIAELIQGDQSLTKKRDELIVELKKVKKPILVILDDLDRLYPEELLMIFKLVRLVGRLPNLHYLLSYDEKTLLDVISQTDLSKNDKARAQNYIEKMVQVKLDLPIMNSHQQLALVNAAHDEVLQRNKIILDDDDNMRVSNAYVECMAHYLDQPRAIKRFFAQIEALYPLVDGEVNFADFTLLTFLRTFEPDVYKLIVGRKNELTSQSYASDRHDESNDDRKKRWMGLLDSVSTKHPDRIFNLLSHLFNPLEGARRNLGYSDTSNKDMLMQKRVGSSEYFDRYFVFGVPEDDISDSKIIGLIDSLNEDEPSASTAIIELIQKDSMLTLKKLLRFQDDKKIPAMPLLKIMASQYLIMNYPDGFMASQPRWIVQELVKKSMSSITESQRVKTFEEIAGSQSGLFMLIESYVYLSDDKEEKLSEVLTKVLTDAITRDMSLLGKKKLSDFSKNDYDLLYPYKALTSSEDLKGWIWAGVKNSNWDPIEILANLVSEATSFGSGKTTKTIGRLDTTVFEEFFGLDKLAEHCHDQIQNFTVDQEFDATFHRKSPTLENKRSYVLELLKRALDSQNSDQEEIEVVEL